MTAEDTATAVTKTAAAAAAAAAASAYSAGRQSFPIMFLIISLVFGSLINSFPDGTSLINVTDLTSNCTNFIAAAVSLVSEAAAATTTAPYSMSTTVALVFALLFPVIFNFLKQSQCARVTSSKTLLPIYNHVSGQILGFSSCEFLRHFLQFPQTDNFVKACNLTEETCNMHENIYTPLNLLCSNSSLDSVALFDTLHTLPNISFVLLGASTVSLLINYMKPKSSKGDDDQLQIQLRDYIPIVKRADKDGGTELQRKVEEEEEEDKGGEDFAEKKEQTIILSKQN